MIKGKQYDPIRELAGKIMDGAGNEGDKNALADECIKMFGNLNDSMGWNTEFKEKHDVLVEKLDTGNISDLEFYYMEKLLELEYGVYEYKKEGRI